MAKQTIHCKLYVCFARVPVYTCTMVVEMTNIKENVTNVIEKVHVYSFQLTTCHAVVCGMLVTSHCHMFTGGTNKKPLDHLHLVWVGVPAVLLEIKCITLEDTATTTNADTIPSMSWTLITSNGHCVLITVKGVH